jgi:hypothetical protein
VRRRHRLLVAAAALAPACSPAPTAHRGQHESSATPPAEAGPDATAASSVATSTGPAPTMSAGTTGSTVASPSRVPGSTVPADPTTTVTVTVPTTPRSTTTTFTLPERADEAMGDDEWLIRQTFPESPDRAVRIARCESGLNPRAINGQHVGAMQVATVVHAKLIARLGYEPADLLDLRVNLKVARAIFDGADGGPRGWAAWSCAA